MITKYYKYLLYPVYALSVFLLVMTFITLDTVKDSSLFSSSFTYMINVIAFTVSIVCATDIMVNGLNLHGKRSEIGLFLRLFLLLLAFVLFTASLNKVISFKVAKGQKIEQIWKSRPIMPNAKLSYVSDTDIKNSIITLGGQHALGAKLFFKNIESLNYHVPMYMLQGLITESKYINRLQQHHLILEIPVNMLQINSFTHVNPSRIRAYKSLSESEYMNMTNHEKRRYARAVNTVKWAMDKGYNNEYLAAVIPVADLVKEQKKLAGSGFDFNQWLYHHLSSGSDETVMAKFNTAIHPYAEQIDCNAVLGPLCKHMAQ